VFVVACAYAACGCSANGSGPDTAERGAVAVNAQALTGVPPVNSLPPPQTTNEDSPLTFSYAAGNAIWLSDDDNTASTVQITVTNGTFFLGPSVNGITVSGNGTHTVILSGPIETPPTPHPPDPTKLTGGINKALDGAHFNPAPDYNGAATLQMNSSDTNGDVDFDVLDISVTSFNDAPVNNVPAGTQVGTEDVPLAFTISVTDVDVGSSPMVVSLSSSNSTLITLPTLAGLTFSSGDGTADASMTFSGTLPDVSAALNGLTITAPPNFIGPTTFVITSNDQGASGAGSPGSDTDTVNIDWAAVNDAPVNVVPGAQTTIEETPVTFSSANGNALSVTDADGPTTLVQVTLSATGGVITLGTPGGVSFTAGDGTADATMTFRGTLFSLNVAMASTVFTPSPNFNGSAVLTMISNDLGNSGSGGAKQDTDTVAINVSGVNDAPVNSVPEAQFTTEDVIETFSSANGNAISVLDVDATTLQVTLTAVQGTITLATRAGLTFQTGDGIADSTTVCTGSIASINAALNGLAFQPSPNFSGQASITVLSNDRGSSGAGGTLSDEDVIAITVVAGNDPPNAVNDALTVTEDSGLAHVQVLANDTAAPDINETLTIIGVSTPLHGSTSTDGFEVTYQPTANYAGADSFTYTISDGNGGIDTATVAVTVTGVNDPPSAVNDSFTVLQNSTTTLGVLSNDSSAPDTGETLTVTAVSTPSHGTATIVSGGSAVSYTSTTGYTGPDAFTYTISDGNGGTATGTVSVTVTAVNTQPVNALPGPQTGSEDSSIFFSSASGNSISVSDSNNTTLTVQVAVTNGTFTLGATAGLVVSNNGSASVTAQGTIASLNSGFNNARYTPTPNFNGAASLTLDSLDSSGESDLDVLTLSVTALNDAPVNSMPLAVQAAVEDVPETFSNISISDVDVGAGQLLVTLTADNGTLISLASTGGLAFSSGDGAGDATMSFTGALSSINAALNGLTVTPTGNFIGMSTLTLTTNDQGNSGVGGPGQDTDTLNITWGSVNDPPVNTVPGPQSINEESPLTFALNSGTALRVSDPDVSAGLMQITLSATSGTLTLGTPGSVTFNSGDGTADVSMTFTGTLASIDTALEGTIYTPAPNFSGTATVTLVSSDLGNSGSGGTKTDTDTVAIAIAGINDAPVNTVPGTQSTNEDVARVFSSANGNGISVSDVDATALQVSLSVTSGSLTLGVKTGLTFQAGDGTADASMTFTGTIASINAALNGMSFSPAANLGGAVSLTVLSSDLGASGTGGTLSDDDTIVINVIPVNDPPDAVNDTLTIDEDAPPTDVLVLANDSTLPDLGESLSIAAVSVPAHGTAVINGTVITYQPAANYRGSDSFTYTVSDGGGGTDTATVAITVVNVNDSPTAANDTFSVLQSSGTNALGVLSNDSSAPDSGETLTIIGLTTAANGTVAITGGGSGLTYTPSPAFTGTDGFTYTISDGNGGTATANVAVTVTAVNTTPVNNLPLPQTTSEDVALVFSSASGNPITVAYANNTTPLTVQISVLNGTFTLGSTAGLTVTGNASANVTATGVASALNTGLNNARYTPSPNFNGAPTLNIDTSAGSASAHDTLTLTVTSINDAPVNVVPVAVQAATEDVPKTFSTISVTDVDVGSGVLQVSLSADNGTLITLGSLIGLSFLTGDGNNDATMTFTGTLPAINAALNALSVSPPANFIGTSTLSMTTSDQGNSGQGGAKQDSDVIDLTWGSVNDPPNDSVPGAQTTNEETPLVFSSAGISLSVSDADIGGGLMRITLSATNGTVSLGNPSVVTFTAGDGTADTTMTFSGTVANVNTALDGASFTPALNFVGAASVTLASNDQGNTGGAAASDSDTIAITVVPVNDAPVNTVPLTQTTNEDVTRTFSAAIGNPITVTDVDATSLQVTLSANNATLTLGALGALTFQSGDGTADSSMTFTAPLATLNSAMNGLRFIPTPNFNGPASLTIQTNDLGASGLGGARIDEDTITVNVTSINDLPDAVNDAFSVAEDAAPVAIPVLANDSTAPDSNEELTVTAVSAPLHGTASTDGITVTYQPAPNYNGADTFSYTIGDGNGGADSATIAIVVSAVNDAPDAVDDSLSVSEGASNAALLVLTNDTTAPDSGEMLTILAISQVAHGTAAVAADGKSVTYTPTFAYNGPDGFTYTISDGNGATDIAMVTIDVTGVDTKPVAVTDIASVKEDMSGSITVLGNDTGLSDLPIMVAIVTLPQHGTVSVASDNSLIYTPAPNYNGSDSLAYSVTDRDGDTATGTVNITVVAVDDLPSAKADSATTEEDTAVVIDALANDEGLGDLPLKVTISTAPKHGKATVATDGSISYKPDADYNGSDTFDYTITDATGSTAAATVSVTVTPVSDPPVAVADTAATSTDVALDIDVLGNDSDVDGDTIQIDSVTAGEKGGTTADNGNGTIHYTPPSGFSNGTDTFSYTISDGQGGSDTASVIVSVGLDTDGDGLLDADEVAHGTSPTEADTDHDGIADGIEVSNGKTDPLDDDSDDDGLLDGHEDVDHDGLVGTGETSATEADTDGDGLKDGTEKGLAKPEGANTAAGAFVPDADPTTKTDPTLADTDKGGKLDGDEDANHNGRVDKGETDPNDPKDDVGGGPNAADAGPDAGKQCGDAGKSCRPTAGSFLPAPKKGCSVGTPSAAGSDPAASLLWLAGLALALIRFGRRRETR
jgi:hypothetical protein